MSTDNLKTWPEKIYLHAEGEAATPTYTQALYNDYILWGANPVRGSVPYIRADLVEQLRAEINRLENLLHAGE